MNAAPGPDSPSRGRNFIHRPGQRSRDHLLPASRGHVFELIATDRRSGGRPARVPDHGSAGRTMERIRTFRRNGEPADVGNDDPAHRAHGP